MTTFQNLKEAMKNGQEVRVRHPDLWMSLMSVHMKLKLTFMELDDAPSQFKVTKTKATKFQPKEFINFRRDGQHDFDKKPQWAFTSVTPASRPMYNFKYGATVETGVNGSEGMEFSKDGEETYQCVMGCGPIHPDMADSNGMNAMMIAYLNALASLKELAFDKMWQDEARFLTKIRAALKNVLDGKKMPKSSIEVAAKLVKQGLYLPKCLPDANDATKRVISMDTSCYHKVRGASDKKPAESTAGYTPPSPLFARHRYSAKNGDERICNELPVWRVKGPWEYDASNSKWSPFEKIPSKNVALSKDDVIFCLYRLAFYEYSAKEQAGFQHKLVGYVWLNTVDAMKQIPINVEPCNPLHGCVYAGYYKGPHSYEGVPPPGWSNETNDAYDEMQRKQAEEAAAASSTVANIDAGPTAIDIDIEAAQAVASSTATGSDDPDWNTSDFASTSASSSSSTSKPEKQHHHHKHRDDNDDEKEKKKKKSKKKADDNDEDM
jgi:hypothetical protein